MAADPVIQPLEAALLEMGVERGEAGHHRDRHQEVAPGIANQALHLALVVALTGPAEAVEEEIVGLQLGKDAGPLARAVAQDARYRQPGVVGENRLRHAAEGERGVVAIAEGLNPLGRVGLDEAGVRVRQVEAEEVDLLPHATDHRHRLAKVGLSMAGWMGQRHEHLLGAGPLLAHIVLDDRVAAGKAVLGPQPVVDPLGGVPLLERRRPVCLQDGVDDCGEGIELGARRWLRPAIARGHREGQHLAHGVAVEAEAPRRLALA